MKNKIYFKFNEHPGDLFRNRSIIELRDPENDLENFLVQFLKHYQSDERIAYVNDLYKLLYEEFYDEEDKIRFIKINGFKTSDEIIDEIQTIEHKLKEEAFENFYHLTITKRIDLIYSEYIRN